ncbi:hypothetical protein [Thalassospira marina]|uniref:Uncharacterized protein n=1 Tax=Thalassospira marina TaxID=2048283 RepID=A0A2N3KUZ2_9PROT|nr:hypothetical protein [Thalassospira marina]PKR54399.1 hypothetical protein COO20_09725 [Thalassospira marina]
MTREIDTDLATEFSAAKLGPIVAVRIGASAGDVRMWSGIGDLTFDGATWLGAGDFLGVSEVTETADVQANGVTFSLSGVSPELVDMALRQIRQGKPAEIYIGSMAENGALIGQPLRVFSGKTDVPVISDDGTSCVVGVTAENALVDLERARVRRYTDQDQKAEYPDDRGFEFVPELQEMEISWGQGVGDK